MWPTIIIATLIAVIFVSIIVRGIQNKRKGKSSCSCGGSCSSCPGGCHSSHQ